MRDHIRLALRALLAIGLGLPGCGEDGSSTDVRCQPACDASACQTCRAGFCASACQPRASCEAGVCVAGAPPVELTFFITSDEHGWMVGDTYEDVWYGGAAYLMGRLRAEGFRPDSDVSILLSGGDSWTGPAISTWYEGESMVEVMNAMGYSAAAVGNHELDFGQDVLAERAGQADYPLLAANLVEVSSGAVLAFASPFVVKEVSGISVGIVGLTVDSLQRIVLPRFVEGIAATDYETALREAVPAVRAAGAELIVALTHVCPDDLLELTPVAAELGIALMSAGHCHEIANETRNGVLVISPGSGLAEYAKIVVEVDAESAEVLAIEGAVLENFWPADEPSPVNPDAVVAAIVETWQARVDEALGETIGYTEDGIDDWALYNLLPDAWLRHFPEADIAFSNTSAYRAAFGPGAITVADVVGVFPFENYVLQMTLTGEEILANLECCGRWLAMGGLAVDARSDEVTVYLDSDEPFDPVASYEVLTTDYLYEREDYFFRVQDPEAIDTGVQWRDPVIDWIREQETSEESPLDDLCDPRPRYQDR